MKLLLHISAILLAIAFVSCKDSGIKPSEIPQTTINDSIVGDSMIYGLTCDGTTDSVIVVYPFSGEDPVEYNCIDAKQAGKIIGKPSIGDWVGLVLDPEDHTTATMIINLDMLKGTWTYPVMPVLKDYMHLSKRMQKRMEKMALQEMPDSVKELYMIPREYGFALKRNHVAQAVGRVFTGSTLEDDSPVEYPTVQNFVRWYAWNGRLILIASSAQTQETDKQAEITRDTLDFISLDEDSLVMSKNGLRYNFHRNKSALQANADATKKAQKAAEQKLKIE